MFRKTILLLAIFLAVNSSFIFAEETNDKGLDPEIVWDDIRFFSEHIDRFAGNNPVLSLDAYLKTYDPIIKSYIVKLAGKSYGGSVDKEKAFEILMRGLTAGTEIKSSSYPIEERDYWIVRATASYYLGQVGADGGLSDVQKSQAIKMLVKAMKYDIEDRVRGTAAISLGKIAATLNSPEDEKPDYSMYRLNLSKFVNKAYIVDAIVMTMDRVNKWDNFSAWAMVYSLGIIKSKEAFFPLLEMRRRGFNTKVKSEISKTLKLIEQ